MVNGETGEAEAVNLHVLYFAILKDARGAAEESLLTRSATALDLYRELARRHGFALDHSGMKVAINDEFATWSDPLNDGDTVAFIPPVAGG